MELVVLTTCEIGSVCSAREFSQRWMDVSFSGWRWTMSLQVATSLASGQQCNCVSLKAVTDLLDCREGETHALLGGEDRLRDFFCALGRERRECVSQVDGRRLAFAVRMEDRHPEPRA